MRTILGIERLAEYDALFRGKKIGLITNFTGISPDWEKDTVEIFKESGYEVAKIFTPEHGLYGAPAGEKVDDMKHPKFGIPVISLYGANRTPKEEDLRDLDVLVYDIQNVGLRYYTYIYTMCYALDAAAAIGLSFVILERPNPLGGSIISGAKISPDYHSFVGDYELPMRYGLTNGEAAGYYLKYTGKSAELTVVPMKNYTKDMLHPDTGLYWNTPSPALPNFECTLGYSGGCLFEAFNISEGRGTGKPFLTYGAPFIDMDVIYQDMKDAHVDDEIVFRRRAFVPSTSKYSGELCFGLEFELLSKKCDFLPTALTYLKCIYQRYSEQVQFRKIPGDIGGHHIAILSGNEWAEEYMKGNMSLTQLKEAWAVQHKEYEDYVKDVRIYR